MADIFGTAGDYTLVGTVGGGVIEGTAGNDYLAEREQFYTTSKSWVSSLLWGVLNAY